MWRRDFCKTLLALPAAAALYASRTRGLPPLTIREVRTIKTGAGGRYQWVFVKILTSEPGLYGLGSASNVHQAMTVAASIEHHLGPFWVGRSADRIEDMWHATNFRSYRRNSVIQNNVLSALDMALWDIKGKRAGMPVYELLGGKARDAVPVYGHAIGRDAAEVEEDVRKYMERGYRHVRAQLIHVGGYGGGGMVPPGQGSRPAQGFAGTAFDEEQYMETIPKLFEHLRVKLGTGVKLIHDVHEHLTPTMALEFARRMEPYRMFFVEDILPPEHIDWFREIRQIASTPMAMGELFTSPREWVPLISERLIDFIRCRISSVGGITAGRKIASLCETFGVRTAWQEGGDNDPINQLAGYHLDLASSAFGIQEDNRFPPLVHEMLPGTAQIKGGYLYGSDSPGLGVDLNEQVAARYPLTPPSGAEDGTTQRGLDGSLVRP
ncbi:MAG: enolase C-terminal domain-like protein [Bryobacteraceae bacterium]